MVLNRRNLFTSSVAAGAALVMGGSLSPRESVAQVARRQAASGRSLMKAGTLLDATEINDESFRRVRRYGIQNVYARAPIEDPKRMYATVAELTRMKEVGARNGVSVDIVRPQNLAMSNIDNERWPAIMLGESPQRDKDIEGFQQLIRNCAIAGIPAIRYTLSIVGNQRTGYVPGRGDSYYRSSRMADFNMNAPLTKAGRVDEDMYWERISYFLDRVVPVANEYKVRLLSHMEDAMVPPGYRGLYPVTNTVAGARRFVSIQESPYHGLLFCIGTFAEMHENPTRDFYDVLREFGMKKKIFLIDFRNIRGNRQEFVETFPDEGEIDMLRCLRILKEVGYDGMICPDHTPQNPDGPEPIMAFQYGYIRGLIQALDQTG
jgi:mannonate dehydratase